MWSYLHPRYQRVTTRTFWEACARKDAKELAAFEIHSLKALEQYPDSIRLPLLGRISVTAVTLEMKYSHPLLGNNRKITDTVYVKKVNGQWKGLWTPEQYAAYAKDRCPPDGARTAVGSAFAVAAARSVRVSSVSAAESVESCRVQAKRCGEMPLDAGVLR